VFVTNFFWEEFPHVDVKAIKVTSNAGCINIFLGEKQQALARSDFSFSKY